MAAPQQSVGFGSVLPIASETTAASQPAGELSSVLGKARMILDAFDTDHSDLSLTELTRRSGVAKATVHRLVGELVEWGLLERAGTKYRLGLRLFELGQLVPRQRILRDAALPYMEDLLLATQETVHFAVRDGIDVLYIADVAVVDLLFVVVLDLHDLVAGCEGPALAAEVPQARDQRALKHAVRQTSGRHARAHQAVARGGSGCASKRSNPL